VKVTINVPAGVTATPSELTFNACNTSDEGNPNNMQSVIFNSSTPGDYGITVTAADTGDPSAYNNSPANFTLHVLGASDTTAPTIECTVPDQTVWYDDNVTVNCTASDASGLADPADASFSLVTSVAAGNETDMASTDSRGVCDIYDNCADAGPYTFKVDRKAPTNIAFVGGGITDGGSYYFGFVPAGPTGCTADDGGSGFASCNVSGGGTSVGPHSYVATATDNVGNLDTATMSYTVLAWTLSGFYQPVDMNGVLNTVKGGSTVPLKFEVFAGSTELTDTSIVSAFSKQVACGVAGTEDTIEVLATGGTSLRYDWTGGQFVYNWQTPKLPGKCYDVTLTTQDGTSITAKFKLK
jgi:hypothetical protein